MYSNGFVCCVIVGGKVMQEGKGGRVQVPFGAEYTIRLRNKNDRNAVATIWIDGENVSGDGWIVNAKTHHDIERRIDSPTKFRFVSQESGEAIDAGKNGDPSRKNGVIEVKWQLEKPRSLVIPRRIVTRGGRDPIWMKAIGDPYPTRPSITMDASNSGQSVCRSMGSSMSFYEAPPQSEQSEDGCTVEGSYSSQTFTYGTLGPMEAEQTVVTLLLVGGPAVAEEETVGSSGFCTNCGLKRVVGNFCGGCGTRFV